MAWTRRRFLVAGSAAAAAATLGGLRWGIPRLTRAGPIRPLSPDARTFVERCFAGLDRSLLWDGHVHLLGFGAGDSGCSVNPTSLSHWHPLRRVQLEVIAGATGMRDEATADRDYLDRLVALLADANPQGRAVALAFDHHVDEHGVERPEHSTFHTPNAYALEAARRHAQLVPGGSVHPYRPDALDRLDAVVEAGACLIKWLPNAMGIDPASPRCDAFYRRLAELDVPLLCHGGAEYAVHAAAGQDLGNPLRLRRALDAGVRVIAAHCASLGSFEDLDEPASARHERPSFELFLRLLRDPRYPELYGDLSSMNHVHHDPHQLGELLRAPELHRRLLYASDYPLPAVRWVVAPWRLAGAGLIAREDRPLLDELFAANPLLFDFAVIRSLRVAAGGSEHRFGRETFETRWIYDPAARC